MPMPSSGWSADQLNGADVPTTRATPVARVVVEVSPPHLDRPFDYAIPEELAGRVAPGQRVMVGFSGQRKRGLVVEVADHTDVPANRLRPLTKLLGDHVWVTPAELDLFRWAARRQGSPVADVVRHALPDRVVDVERSGERAGWWPGATSSDGPTALPDAPTGRPVTGPTPGTGASLPETADPADGWGVYGAGAVALWSAAMTPRWHAVHWSPLAGEATGARLVELVRSVVASGRQVLVITPDSQSRVADAMAAAFDAELVADVRGDTSARVTYRGWLRARAACVDLVIGERGVAFWPMPRLGLTILLDEANPAAKERRSPRHHAREVLLERSRRAGVPCVLVGHVPSAQAWRLHRADRLDLLAAPRAQQRHGAPLVRLGADATGPRARFSRTAVGAIRAAVDAGAYAVVLAARRGEGRALVCSSCGTRSVCPTCGVGLTHERAAMTCESCGWQMRRPPRCVDCGRSDFSPLAAGTARLATELRRTVKTPVVVLEGYAPDVPDAPAVLVCTRGAILDEPPGPVGAVVLADVDGLLRRPALDAAEDTLRLCLRAASWLVSGRDGRDPARPVVVETRDPDHPVVRALRRWDPVGFWEAEEATRAPLRFPPCADAIRLDGPVAEPDGWVIELARVLPRGTDLLGPLPTEAGARVLLKTDDRVATVDAIALLRRQWSVAGIDVRLDVDPVDVG